MKKWIRIFLGTLLMLGLAPVVLADGADGLYKPTELSGYVKVGGKRFDLPLKELRDALLKNGVLVVKGNRIPVHKVKWANLMERFHFKNLRGPASTVAPDNVVLRSLGDVFVGSTTRPLVITQKGKVNFVTVKAKMDTRLKTRIEGDILTMEAPVRISALGVTAKGRIVMKAERQPLPPMPGPAGAAE